MHRKRLLKLVDMVCLLYTGLKLVPSIYFFFIPECFVEWFRDDSEMEAVLFHELK